jgi:hypothetical protein
LHDGIVPFIGCDAVLHIPVNTFDKIGAGHLKCTIGVETGIAAVAEVVAVAETGNQFIVNGLIVDYKLAGLVSDDGTARGRETVIALGEWAGSEDAILHGPDFLMWLEWGFVWGLVQIFPPVFIALRASSKLLIGHIFVWDAWCATIGAIVMFKMFGGDHD